MVTLRIKGLAWGFALIDLKWMWKKIVDLDKPKIIRNSGELSDLEYLPTKTENVRYLQNMEICTYCL